MAQTQKVLGQATLAAITLTPVYTVPLATSAIVSSIIICNTNATAVTFRISIAKAGVADTIAQYIAYDNYLDAKSSYMLTLGMTLAATDVVRVYSSATLVTANLFGLETT